MGKSWLTAQQKPVVINSWLDRVGADEDNTFELVIQDLLQIFGADKKDEIFKTINTYGDVSFNFRINNVSYQLWISEEFALDAADSDVNDLLQDPNELEGVPAFIINMLEDYHGDDPNGEGGFDMDSVITATTVYIDKFGWASVLAEDGKFMTTPHGFIYYKDKDGVRLH